MSNSDTSDPSVLSGSSSFPVSEGPDPLRSDIAKKQTRDSHGRFIPKVDPLKVPPISFTATPANGKVSTTNPPDLLNVKVTNPLVYIKYWWKRIMANEGMDLRFKVKPITAIAMAVVAFSLAFGIGGVTFPVFFPWMKSSNSSIINTTTEVTPTPEQWKETALKGTLKKTLSIPPKYYLLVSSDEAITLQILTNINLEPLIGKRIFVSGSYNQKDKLLIVNDVQDLEVLPTKAEVAPTNSPTPSPFPTEVLIPTAVPAY